MNITFIGTGYVGLVSGIMMSYLGHNVTCLDTDTQKIAQLKNNILPIYEPKLEPYLAPLIESGRLKFIDTYNSDLHASGAIFITVGTPPLPSGEADLQYIFRAIDSLSHWITQDCLIIIKSTVPPTTCNQIITYLHKKNLHFPVASNPEFLREGSAVDDFLNPDRIVIGTNSKAAEDLLREIYLPLTTKNAKIVSTDLVTAELTKYASNSFLATKIAFTNEMANLCEQTGANIKELTLAMGMDHRIGKECLNAGPGFGGSCFPKDLLALAQVAKNFHTECQIIESVINSNNQRPYEMVKKIYAIINNHSIAKHIDITQLQTSATLCGHKGQLKGIKYNLPAEINFSNKIIAVLGLTFKAGTDDIRSSAAIKIIKILLDREARIQTFDPMGMLHTKKYLEALNYKNIFFAKAAFSACQNSDVILITTEWPEFTTLPWENVKTQAKNPIIIDLRNILDGDHLKSIGFSYHCIGHGKEFKEI